MTIAVNVKNDEPVQGRYLAVVRLDPGSKLEDGPKMSRETFFLKPQEEGTYYIHQGVQLIVAEGPLELPDGLEHA